jgi:uncharacterized protein (DUF1800 family)
MRSIFAAFRYSRFRWGFAVCVSSLAIANAAQAQLSHFPDPIFHDGYNGLDAAGVANIPADDAARFLTQATFGPTDADIAHLRTVGYQAWLTEQFNATPSYEMTYLNWVGNTLQEQIGQQNRNEAWLLGALGGPDPQNNLLIHNDQLRQRVAFALSEIFVISRQNSTLDLYGAAGMAAYYDILIRNAFGNFRTLLQEVTLSPAMGVYLNMMGSRRANLAENQHPDENYGREINQLFSIGLVMLNADGTPQLDGNGQPIPTYTQSTITNFAHVFTGWNWAHCDADGYDNFIYCFTPYDTPDDFVTPMVAYDQADSPQSGDPSYHDNGTDPVNDISNKQLLQYPGAANGGVLADGGTAMSDLTFALDNIFHHPNVGPFISKQLIQRLVTSNPSPAYVARVAAVFNDDGSAQHVRGNLRAVVKAILLDPEARYGQFHYPVTFGKLREPLLVLTHFWRAMHASHTCGLDVPASGNSAGSYYANQPYRYAGYSTGWSLDDTQYGSGVAQAPLNAFSVFNFFRPDYLPAGEMANQNLLGPEFGMQTDSIIANSTNTLGYRAFYFDSNETCGMGDLFGDITIDHSQDAALAGSANGGAADPSDALVNAYDLRFMSGQMSPFMRQQLLDYLNEFGSDDGEDWRLLRIQRALLLILNSPEYMIQK